MEARLTRRLGRVLLFLALLCAPLGVQAAGVPSPSATDRDFLATVARAKDEMLRDPVRAARSGGAALALAERATEPRRAAVMRATALWLMGEAWSRQGEPRRALPLLRRAQGEIAQSAPRGPVAADIMLSLGGVLVEAGRIAEALQTLQRAHDLFRDLGDQRSRAKALIVIALLYDSARDHAAALRYYGQAIEASSRDPGLSVAIYNGRGMSLIDSGRVGDAEQQFARALVVARAMRSVPTEASILWNLAHAQLLLGWTALAERGIAQGMILTRDAEAAGFRPLYVALAAEAALRRGDLPRALRLIDERFAGVDLAHTIRNDREAHDTAYRIYRAAGDDAAALAHLAALKRLDDQATAIARSNGAQLAAARFDYANQELRITQLKAAALQKAVAFERQAARTQRLVFIGAGVATAIVVGLLVFGVVTLRRSRDQVRAANADLAASNVALEKALAAKTEFLAATSHEIRTPLNGILGMTQVMIADPALEPRTRDRLAIVHGAGTTMRALVDDILDMAKIETGKMTIEAVAMDFRATIADAAQLWREQAAHKGLAFALELDAAPVWIMADPARLRQIAFNLLSNAVKFTATGGVHLSAAAGDGRLRLVVRDTGIGIDPAVHEAIFEPFRQADAGTTRQFGGTGLGLSICRNLARGMGGDVTVESLPGAGATFTLDMPLELATAPHGVEERAALLVVERNPIQRAMFKSLFAPLGPVVFADDAADAIDEAHARRPERVLVDAAALADTGVLARVAAACGGAPVCVLAAAGDGARWRVASVAQVIERPIGKKSLVAAIMALSSPLVGEAA
jgi:signal transduction histidine kinase